MTHASNPLTLAEGLLRFGPHDASTARRLVELGPLALDHAAAQLAELAVPAQRTVAQALAMAPRSSPTGGLLRCAASPDAEVAVWGLRGLAQVVSTDDAGALRGLVERISRHASPLVRAALADLVGGFEPLERPRALLQRLVRDEDAFVRERAHAALADVPSDDPAERAALGLLSVEADVREAAVRSLVASDDYLAVQRRLLADASARVVESALRAATERPDPGLWVELTRIIEHPSTTDHVRALALASLTIPDELDDDRVVAWLGRWLHHRDSFVRAAVARPSARSRHRATRVLARTLLRDPDPFVRDAAERALLTLAPPLDDASSE